jgi:hypothetical protein
MPMGPPSGGVPGGEPLIGCNSSRHGCCLPPGCASVFAVTVYAAVLFSQQHAVKLPRSVLCWAWEQQPACLVMKSSSNANANHQWLN